MGPISKLQNALSFNYFANTHVYDPRADYISKDRPIYDFEEKDSVGNTVTKSAIAKESPTGYYINDGTSYAKYINSLNNGVNSEFISNTDQPLDQVIDEQAVNSGPNNNEQPTVTASNVEDTEIVNSLNIVNYSNYTTEQDILTISLAYKKSGIPLNLKHENPKTYKGQVYLINGVTKINIGYISVVSNGLDNGVLFKTNSGAEIEISPNIKNNETFNLVLVFDDESISNSVKDLFVKSETMLKLEWETGGISQCNFNKNIN
jgi:hypothetical protein